MTSDEHKQAIINKVLNHNVVQCYDTNHKKEYLIHGKGIGFKRTIGEYIDIDSDMKIYEIKDQVTLSAYESLLDSSKDEIIHLSEEIIERLTKRFGNNYNENIHVSLLDHLNFSIYRYRHDIHMQNMFLMEIETMYPNEYQFSKEMVQFVNESLNVNLPEAEVGFICMHIHSAYHADTASNTALTVAMIGRCITYIEEKTNKRINLKSIERQRLVTHLKFAFKRAKDNMEIRNPLSESIHEKNPNAFALAKDLANVIYNEFDLLLPDGEIGYLAIHVHSILLSDNKS